MQPSLGTFFRAHRRTFFGLCFLSLFSITVTYANPPTTAYQPGAVLDPTCAPGDTNCTVTLYPDQTGNNGKYLMTDGSSVSWASVVTGGGTVTSVAALTLGTSGTDINSTITNPTTTPVITLNIPDASYTARGVVTTGTQTFAGTKIFKGSTATDRPVSSSVSLGVGTGTNWTGTDFITGYTHTTGSTAPLVTSVAASYRDYYSIYWTITGRTTGSVVITFGGETVYPVKTTPVSANITASGTSGVRATSTAVFTITPTADFNGTIAFASDGVILNASTVRSTPLINLVQSTKNIGSGYELEIRMGEGAGNFIAGKNAGGHSIFGTMNSVVGYNAMSSGVNTIHTNSIGGYSLTFLVNGTGNTAIGGYAGNQIGTGAITVATNESVNLRYADYSMFLGYDSRAQANNQTNQIVIGNFVTGLGSDTTSIGNSATTLTGLYGALKLLGGYGTGTKTGIATYNLAVDASGNVIETRPTIGSTSVFGTETWLGTSATGLGTASTNNTVFMGINAGQNATNATNSIFIGQNAGFSDSVNNISSTDNFSILIGKSTSTGGFSNSIAIGGNATNTATNQFMIGSTNRPINEVVIKGSGTCSIVSTGISCSSDERLKTNIENLPTTTLDTLVNVRTVLYNWNSDPNGDKIVGFLAQDLEQYYPQLVRTDSDGYKMVNYAQMTPILVEAIREMNVKITGINDLETPNTFRESMVAWFANMGNGIEKLFAKEVHSDTLCLGQTCITESQLKTLLEQQPSVVQNTNTPPSTDAPGDSQTPTPTKIIPTPDTSEITPPAEENIVEATPTTSVVEPVGQ